LEGAATGLHAREGDAGAMTRKPGDRPRVCRSCPVQGLIWRGTLSSERRWTAGAARACREAAGTADAAVPPPCAVDPGHVAQGADGSV